MPNRPVAIFDSGVGGMSALRAFTKLMPGEDIIYLGDTARMPYGVCDDATIRRYTEGDIAFLLTQNPKILVAACGTISSNMTPEMLAALPVPFVGVVEPAAARAAQMTKNGKIGVLATDATVRSGSLEQAIKRHLPTAQVYSLGCPELVTLVESGDISPDSPTAQAAVARHLEGFLQSGSDTLVLGCTHFPLISDIFAAQLGDSVTLVDTGYEAARRTGELLAEQGLLATGEGRGRRSYCLTSVTDGFLKSAGFFLGEDIDRDVKLVTIV